MIVQAYYYAMEESKHQRVQHAHRLFLLDESMIGPLFCLDMACNAHFIAHRFMPTFISVTQRMHLVSFLHRDESFVLVLMIIAESFTNQVKSSQSPSLALWL